MKNPRTAAFVAAVASAVRLLALSLSVAVICGAQAQISESVLNLDRARYAEGLHGFWLGQSIANWTGLVTEMDRVEPPFYDDDDWGRQDQPSVWGHFAAHASRIDFFLAPAGAVWGADDDTDIEYLYLQLMHDSASPLLSAAQIRDGWLRHIYSNEDAPLSPSSMQRENYLWVSNERAYYLMRDGGLLPPATSEPQHNPDSQMIDAQLTTELFGLLAPGRPDIALQLAELPIRVTASGEAAAIARFYVVMHSIVAGVGQTGDVHRVLLEAAAHASRALPEGGYALDMYRFVRAHYEDRAATGEWAAARDALYRAYQQGGRAGYAYRQPYDAGINFGASLVSLFYGQGDLKRTIRIASLAGWDSDNPAATWGGLLGFLLGRDGVEAAFGGAPLAEDYWIHRTRRGFKDHTPGSPGEDRFSLMAARGVTVTDRVVIQMMGGTVDPGKNHWVIPGVATAAPAL